MRPLGLIIIWQKTGKRWEIMKTGLFGYYQNAYRLPLRICSGQRVESLLRSVTAGTVAFETRQYQN